MSVLFTDSMTVYNCHRDIDTGKEVWNRTVVKGVQWSHNKSEVTVSGNVLTESKVEKITVDFQRNHGNKPYLPPQEYARLAAVEAGDYWTLNAKSGLDVLVLGETEKEIGKGYKLTQLRDDYQYVVTVTAVSDNRNRPRLKSIKVVGR